MSAIKQGIKEGGSSSLTTDHYCRSMLATEIGQIVANVYLKYPLLTNTVIKQLLIYKSMR